MPALARLAGDRLRSSERLLISDRISIKYGARVGAHPVLVEFPQKGPGVVHRWLRLSDEMVVGFQS